MKRLFILILILAAGSWLFAQQVVLTYRTHGLAAGYVNEMKMATYVDPGPGGNNQVWDLSKMEPTKDFRGFIAQAKEVDTNLLFTQANVVLNEEGRQFFFCFEEDALTAWGRMSGTGQALTKYHRPYIKMKYPFSYGDEFSGDYEGTYYLTGKEIPLTGKYSVKADGKGKLILPGGNEVNNTLRVVSSRSYDLMMENGTQTYEILAYRWYNNSDRFPIAVLITTWNSVCSPEHYCYTAAYRIPGAPVQYTEIKSEAGESAEAESIQEALPDLVRIYPNPVKDEFTIEFTVNAGSDVLIELYDNTGNKVAALVNQHKQAGVYSESFNTKKYGLTHGIYHIRGIIGNQSSTTTFIRE